MTKITLTIVSIMIRQQTIVSFKNTFHIYTKSNVSICLDVGNVHSQTFIFAAIISYT